MSHSYLVYGLSCTSNLPIPGLQERTGLGAAAEFEIIVATRPPAWTSEAEKLSSCVTFKKSARPETGDSAFKLITFGAAEYFELNYVGESKFLIDLSGKRIWCAVSPPLVIEDLAVYLRGPVMGFVLRQRSTTALHASAVSIEGNAVALCGQSQAGKSTTAAAFALLGIPVICEDIMALTEDHFGFRAEVGYPRVCLWRDSMEFLTGKTDALPQLTPTWEKFYMPLDSNSGSFEQEARKLGVIYLLASRRDDENAPRVEQVTPREALLELVQNTYMNWLLTPAQRASEFDVLSRLVMNVPVRRLVPHSSPERIGKLCELILSDAKKTVSERPYGIQKS